jgi:hypothetical protein
VKIVLSTSWVNHFPYAADYLPVPLRERVIGEIKHLSLTRGALVVRHAEQNAQESWIAIDDDYKDWPEGQLDRLVRCNGKQGLSDPATQAELRQKLEQYA